MVPLLLLRQFGHVMFAVHEFLGREVSMGTASSDRVIQIRSTSQAGILLGPALL
jgi:hypothetical protein